MDTVLAYGKAPINTCEVKEEETKKSPTKPSKMLLIDGNADQCRKLEPLTVEEITSVFCSHVKANILDVYRKEFRKGSHLALVELGSIEEAQKAISILDGITLSSKHKLSVSFNDEDHSRVPTNDLIRNKKSHNTSKITTAKQGEGSWDNRGPAREYGGGPWTQRGSAREYGRGPLTQRGSAREYGMGPWGQKEASKDLGGASWAQEGDGWGQEGDAWDTAWGPGGADVKKGEQPNKDGEEKGKKEPSQSIEDDIVPESDDEGENGGMNGKDGGEEKGKEEPSQSIEDDIVPESADEGENGGKEGGEEGPLNDDAEVYSSCSSGDLPATCQDFVDAIVPDSADEEENERMNKKEEGEERPKKDGEEKGKKEPSQSIEDDIVPESADEGENGGMKEKDDGEEKGKEEPSQSIEDDIVPESADEGENGGKEGGEEGPLNDDAEVYSSCSSGDLPATRQGFEDDIVPESADESTDHPVENYGDDEMPLF